MWAYSNVQEVELFLDGRSLGVRRFDRKTTLDGRPYLETSEETHDDKTVTGGPHPGSYTSPNGSAGKLHLTWHVPFAPGRLVAVARRDGRVVARDELRTAGEPDTVRLTPDKRVIAADGKALSYVTADVVDRDGTIVPSADDQITFKVTGGRLAGTDNGREESAENYQSPVRARRSTARRWRSCAPTATRARSPSPPRRRGCGPRRRRSSRASRAARGATQQPSRAGSSTSRRSRPRCRSASRRCCRAA